MVTIHQSSSTTLASHTADFIARFLAESFTVGPTLLLISGGSVATDVVPQLIVQLNSCKLPASSYQLLDVALVDERFGEPWHSESNMLAVKKSGFTDWMKQHHVSFFTPLAAGKFFTEAAKKYNDLLRKELSKAGSRTIAVLGMGTDGHTAGIKPQKDGTAFQKSFCSSELVMGYQADDFARITLSLSALEKMKLLVCFAQGKEKRAIVKKLFTHKDDELSQFPALVLQKHPNAHLFTDQPHPDPPLR